MTAFPEGYDPFETPADTDLLGGSRPGATGVKQRKIALSALWSFFRAKLTTTPATLAEGGTGAATAEAARTALEVPSTTEVNEALALKATTSDLAAETAEREAADALSAKTDLANVPAGSVSSALLAASAVTLAKLGEDVSAVLAGGQTFPLADRLGEITALGDALADPTTSEGKWYYCSVVGTMTGTNPPADDVSDGSYIYSDGTAWLVRAPAPTIIPAESITRDELDSAAKETIPAVAPDSPFGMTRQIFSDVSGRGGLLVYADGRIGGRAKHSLSSALLSHRVAMGQSLSLGSESGPVLSDTPLYPEHALMFSTGACCGLASPGSTATVIDFAAITKLEPLVEVNGVDPDVSGETIGSGLTRQLTASRLALDSAATIDRTLFSACGVGGIAYANLKKGTVPYENALRVYRRGKALADFYGYFYDVPSFLWLQGEADLPSTTAENYTLYLATLQKDLAEDVSDILGWSAAPVLLTYQISGFSNAYTFPGTTAGQLAAHESFAPVFVVSPTYIFPCARNNSTHLTAEGYYLLGEYFAKAEAAAIAGTWDVVRPTAVERTGAVIDITFAVPVAPLVFDSALFDDPGNEGFRYTDSAGVITISTVEVLGDGETVRVTLSADPSVNTDRTLYYAYPGVTGVHTTALDGELHPIARGRLRDSEGTASSLDGRALNNWSVHFILDV